MTHILFLSKNKLFEKVIELALYNYEVEVEFIVNEDNVPENFEDVDVIVLDDDFSSNIETLLKKFISTQKPVILLKNIFDETSNYSELKDVTIIEKPFEDPIFIESLKKVTSLKLKTGEKAMNEPQKPLSNPSESQQDDVLELTDIVEEAAEEVSDILSAKNESKESEEFDLSDFNDNMEEPEEVINLTDTGGSEAEETTLMDSKKQIDLTVEEKSEDKDIDKNSEMVSTKADDFSEEKVDTLLEQKSFETTSEIKEKKEEDVVSVTSQEPLENTSPIAEVEPEKENALDKSEEVLDEITESEYDNNENIQIPVDEETKKLAEEIENGNFEHIKEEEYEEPLFTEKKLTDSYKPIDVSLVEMKLLEASGKILEAIEEATVEIAKGIAKVTPKIIEEVANEIIPKIAKKIISEELEKSKKE